MLLAQWRHCPFTCKIISLHVSVWKNINFFLDEQWFFWRWFFSRVEVGWKASHAQIQFVGFDSTLLTRHKPAFTSYTERRKSNWVIRYRAAVLVDGGGRGEASSNEGPREWFSFTFSASGTDTASAFWLTRMTAQQFSNTYISRRVNHTWAT